MKAIYYNGTTYEYRTDYPKPIRTCGHSLIKIQAAALCNTDREILKGYRPAFRGVMGHEFVGVVEDSDKEELIGKRVVGELNEGCGHCIYCRTGREKHCPDRKVIGMEQLDGCFAEYMVLADHLLHIVPEELDTKTALFTEPLAAALEIPSMLSLNPALNACIIGDGRLALMIAQVMRLSGIDLAIIGKYPEKLNLFADCGRTYTIQEALQRTSNNPENTYEIVVDATGSPTGLDMASKLVRKRGTIVLKSTYASATQIDMSYFVVNEITIMGSRCGPFAPALNLLKNGLIHLPEITFFDISEFDKMLNAQVFKAGIKLEG